MKIVPGMAGPSEVRSVTPAGPAQPSSAPSAPAAAATLQSAVLKPALEALRAQPEIDHARVAELRDALARGELPFDSAKLAALIARYHGVRR